jgi:hypothetical protein
MTTPAEAAREKLARLICSMLPDVDPSDCVAVNPGQPGLRSKCTPENCTPSAMADAILAAFPQLSAAPNEDDERVAWEVVKLAGNNMLRENRSEAAVAVVAQALAAARARQREADVALAKDWSDMRRPLSELPAAIRGTS